MAVSRRNLVAICLTIGLVFYCKNPDSTAGAGGAAVSSAIVNPLGEGALLKDANPIHFAFKKGANGALKMGVVAASGYAIQVINEQMVWESGGKKETVRLNGTPRDDKSEYYAKIEPVDLSLAPDGVGRLAGKIYFCNLNQNYCTRKNLDIPVQM